MAEAVARLKELSADERERLRADARDKWLWDTAARERQYLAEGMTKGRMDTQAGIARRMLLAKMPLDGIAALTGLSKADVRRLPKQK